MLRALSGIYGIPFYKSALVPEFTEVYVPPRNRREARKRAVIATRRQRAGKPIPQYMKRERVVYLMTNGNGYKMILINPRTEVPRGE
jgi:hypothetical protein